jgi:hypothetical protein
VVAEPVAAAHGGARLACGTVGRGDREADTALVARARGDAFARGAALDHRGEAVTFDELVAASTQRNGTHVYISLAFVYWNELRTGKKGRKKMRTQYHIR